MEKLASNLNRHFTKGEDIQLVSKLISSEVQIKTTMNWHCTLTRIAKIKDNTKKKKIRGEKKEMCPSGMLISTENLCPDSKNEVCSMVTNPSVWSHLELA